MVGIYAADDVLSGSVSFMVLGLASGENPDDGTTAKKILNLIEFSPYGGGIVFRGDSAHHNNLEYLIKYGYLMRVHSKHLFSHADYIITRKGREIYEPPDYVVLSDEGEERLRTYPQSSSRFAQLSEQPHARLVKRYYADGTVIHQESILSN